MGKYYSIIDSLSNDEIYIMEILGGLSVSPNKNIRINTLTKRIHDKYTINLDKTLKKLKNKTLLGEYRPNNIRLSRKGMITAKILYKKKRKKLFPDLKYLLFFD